MQLSCRGYEDNTHLVESGPVDLSCFKQISQGDVTLYGSTVGSSQYQNTSYQLLKVALPDFASNRLTKTIIVKSTWILLKTFLPLILPFKLISTEDWLFSHHCRVKTKVTLDIATGMHVTTDQSVRSAVMPSNAHWNPNVRRVFVVSVRSRGVPLNLWRRS